MPENMVSSDPNPCQVCGAGPEPGFAAPLCRSCRRALSRRPFPLWVKGFSIVTALLLGFSLLTLPSVLRADIAFEKGKNAESRKCYLTAAREFGKAATLFPDCTEILARLYVSNFRAGRIEEALKVIGKIGGRKDENSALVTEVNGVTTRMKALFDPSPDFEKFFTDHQKDNAETLRTALMVYVSDHPGEVLATLTLAQMNFDASDFDGVERVLSGILTANPDCRAGLLLLAAALREKKDYDGALAQCRKVLDQDAEAIDAFAATVRIELKRHRDPEALALARKAMALDPQDGRAQEALAMALHYNGQLKERDEVYRRFQSNPTLSEEERERLSGIISGTLKWRD